MSQASIPNAIKRFKETGGDGNRKTKQNGLPRISTDRDDRFLPAHPFTIALNKLQN